MSKVGSASIYPSFKSNVKLGFVFSNLLHGLTIRDFQLFEGRYHIKSYKNITID